MPTKDYENDTLGGSVGISSEYITFSGTVIPTRSISRLRSYQFSRKRQTAVLFGALGLAALLGAAFFAQSKQQERAILLAMVGLSFCGASLRSLFFKRFGLSIETNGGTRDFILSKNKKFAEEVLRLILDTMAQSDKTVSYTVNMAKGDIISQSGVFGTGVDKRNT